jgi:hypothetical protein
VQDMKSRKIYQLLLSNDLFSTIVVLRRDKSYYTERICQ